MSLANGAAGVRRIETVFHTLAEQGQGALIPFLMGGDPGLEESRSLLLAAARAGADLLEVGIPFSDPLADGPTLQAAAGRALAAGATPGRVLELVASVRQETGVPIVALTYYNLLYRRGIARFLEDARAAGLDGLILPDVPVDEAEEVAAGCAENGLACVLLAAPTSHPGRLARIAGLGTGFVYCVSMTGVTGARRELDPSLGGFLQRVREACGLPLAVGFGISRPEHVAQVMRYADGAIVGSALVDRLAAARGPEEAVKEVSSLIRQLKAAAVRSVGAPSPGPAGEAGDGRTAR